MMTQKLLKYTALFIVFLINSALARDILGSQINVFAGGFSGPEQSSFAQNNRFGANFDIYSGVNDAFKLNMGYEQRQFSNDSSPESLSLISIFSGWHVGASYSFNESAWGEARTQTKVSGNYTFANYEFNPSINSPSSSVQEVSANAVILGIKQTVRAKRLYASLGATGVVFTEYRDAYRRPFEITARFGTITSIQLRAYVDLTSSHDLKEKGLILGLGYSW